ncbi:MAG: hypothetical protein JXA99_14445 [Candidatus Lokiarchaeota archaeon]|nr:hypothetical protein [Candidatus Lokiarchaeota archaeon]
MFNNKHLSKKYLVSIIFISFSLLFVGSFIYLLVIKNIDNNEKFIYLNNPPSTTGTGSILVYEVMVRDTLTSPSYNVYFGINWIDINENSIDYSCYFSKYTNIYLNHTRNSTITSTITSLYKWDSEIYDNTNYFLIIWIKLENTNTKKQSITYKNITNWNYNTIIEHNSTIYSNDDWFWFSNTNSELIGNDFAGAISLKFELKTNI